MYLCWQDLNDYLKQGNATIKKAYGQNLEFYHGIRNRILYKVTLERKFLLIETSKAQELLGLDLSILQVKQYTDVVRIDSQSFDKMLQKIEKFNARALKSELVLKSNSDMLSEAISFTRNNTGKTILCFDVEVLETCHRYILEIGWCTYTTGLESEIHAKHYIVEENLDRRNGRYVPDHKHLFEFGTSEVRPLQYVVNQFIQDLIKVDCIIGHSVDSDLKFMQRFLEYAPLDQFMIHLDYKKNKIKTVKFNTANVSVQLQVKRFTHFPIQVKKFDTMCMTSVVLGDAFNQCSLKRALQLFDSTKDDEYTFHNAGNDAYASMKLFLALVFSDKQCFIYPNKLKSDVEDQKDF